MAVDSYDARSTKPVKISVIEADDYVRITIALSDGGTSVDLTPRQARRFATSVEVAAGHTERFTPSKPVF
jgi:hypothetical protein